MDRTGDCWTWVGPVRDDGYGGSRVNGKKFIAHRLAYELFVGPIPQGKQLDHLCHHKLCVNPEHLRPVSGRVNQQNRKGANRAGSSGVRGVHWHSGARKWRAHVGHQRRTYFGELRANKELAEADAVELRLLLHGEASTADLCRLMQIRLEDHERKNNK